MGSSTFIAISHALGMDKLAFTPAIPQIPAKNIPYNLKKKSPDAVVKQSLNRAINVNVEAKAPGNKALIAKAPAIPQAPLAPAPGTGATWLRPSRAVG